MMVKKLELVVVDAPTAVRRLTVRGLDPGGRLEARLEATAMSQRCPARAAVRLPSAAGHFSSLEIGIGRRRHLEDCPAAKLRFAPGEH